MKCDDCGFECHSFEDFDNHKCEDRFNFGKALITKRAKKSGDFWKQVDALAKEKGEK